MIVSIISWAFRVIGFLSLVVAAFTGFSFGLLTFRVVAWALYGLTMVTLLFGCCGKSMSKKPSFFYTCALPWVVLLGGFAGMGFIARSRSLELANEKIVNNKSLSELFNEEGHLVFDSLYDQGRCQAFKCEKKMTGLLFSWRYLDESDDRVSQRCRSVYNATAKSEVLTTVSSLVSLGVFKRLEELINTKVPVGMEKEFVWCHIERGFFSFLANIWTVLCWTALSVGLGLIVQTLVTSFKKAARSSK